MVNRDANGESLLATDTGSLDLFEGEATAGSELGVVLYGWAANSRSEEFDGTRSDAGSLFNTGISSSLFAAWLIEPCLDTALPVLVEMVVGKLVIVTETYKLANEMWKGRRGSNEGDLKYEMRSGKRAEYAVRLLKLKSFVVENLHKCNVDMST